MKYALCVLVVFGIACMTWSCKSELEIEAEQLVGAWEVISAERNGRPTELVNGAVFNFTDDGHMMTNLTGEEEHGRFTLQDNSIMFEGHTEVTYHVGNIEADAMSLETNIQRMRFNLDLVRMEAAD